VQVGQSVAFLNSDPLLHNVRTVAERNAAWNDLMPTRDTRLSKRFEQPEVMVHAKCDIHPWMSAFIGVLPHAYFAVSNDRGEVLLRNVPPGEYGLEAWHEVFGRLSRPVKVTAQATAEAEFVFQAR
jgi:hypothetical protein